MTAVLGPARDARPVIGIETMSEVHHLRVRQQLEEAGVEVVPDLFTTGVDGRAVSFINVYARDRVTTLAANWIVMSTTMPCAPAAQGMEMVGDAVARRGTYEAVFKGYRQARKL
jgi:hypothetical protein